MFPRSFPVFPDQASTMAGRVDALYFFLIGVSAFFVILISGLSVYYSMGSPPPNTLDIYVVGKQWMFKFQHPGGQREIDELHVPVGRAVKLTMTSEDVIHDLYIPAFRV